MICLIETTKEASFCPILASKITSTLADVHHVIISVVVLLRPSSIPMSTQGKDKIKRFFKNLQFRHTSASACRRNVASRQIQSNPHVLQLLDLSAFTLKVCLIFLRIILLSSQPGTINYVKYDRCFYLIPKLKLEHRTLPATALSCEIVDLFSIF